jgi:hypothetical protein
MALLKILSEHLCEEHLTMIGSTLPSSSLSPLNDCFRAKQSNIDIEVIDEIKMQLANEGFQAWVTDFD